MAMLGRSGLEQQTDMMTGGRQGDLSMDSGDTSIRVRSIRGFRVFSAYDSSDKEGMIVTFLGGSHNSTFVFQFNGISLDDALTLAQRFDWTAMQRAVSTR